MLKNSKKTAAVLLALALAFSTVACGAGVKQSGASESTDTAVEESADTAVPEELFSKRDLSGEYSDCVTVSLDGSGAKADGAGVEIGDGLVTITAAGSYLLTGSFNGRVEIRAGDEDKVQLVLSEASIASDGARIRHSMAQSAPSMPTVFFRRSPPCPCIKLCLNS